MPNPSEQRVGTIPAYAAADAGGAPGSSPPTMPFTNIDTADEETVTRKKIIYFQKRCDPPFIDSGPHRFELLSDVLYFPFGRSGDGIFHANTAAV